MFGSWSYQRACVLFSFGACIFSIIMFLLISTGDGPNFVNNTDNARLVFFISSFLYLASIFIYNNIGMNSNFIEFTPFLIFSISMIITTKENAFFYIILILSMVVALFNLLYGAEKHVGN